jgi:hypothetical protein
MLHYKYTIFYVIILYLISIFRNFRTEYSISYNALMFYNLHVMLSPNLSNFVNL